MKYRDILIFGEPVLKEKSKEVQNIDSNIRKTLKNMYEIMKRADGVGLAAPQIGIPLRLVVIDVGEGPIFMVNPEITWYSKEEVDFEEGCLSFPGVAINITRPEKVKVAFLDEKGRKNFLEADGLLARAIQHEVDHLDGVLIIDRATKTQRMEAIQKLQENIQQIEETKTLTKE
ncbi:MAG: peptide deformylase [Actinobacteria bacterium]|nr:peptide deformylase [Actinomycetota bacterium]